MNSRKAVEHAGVIDDVALLRDGLEQDVDLVGDGSVVGGGECEQGGQGGGGGGLAQLLSSVLDKTRSRVRRARNGLR